MPTKTGTYRISKTIDAPLPFVYEWCTDFRDDDPLLTGSKTKRRTLEKTKDRVIYLGEYTLKGKKYWHASVISLKPPRNWHLETAGDPFEKEVGDYKLTALGKEKTKLDMAFKVYYNNVPYKILSRKEWEDDSSKFWDKLISALHRDYAKRN